MNVSQVIDNLPNYREFIENTEAYPVYHYNEPSNSLLRTNEVDNKLPSYDEFVGNTQTRSEYQNETSGSNENYSHFPLHK